MANPFLTRYWTRSVDVISTSYRPFVSKSRGIVNSPGPRGMLRWQASHPACARLAQPGRTARRLARTVTIHPTRGTLAEAPPLNPPPDPRARFSHDSNF